MREVLSYMRETIRPEAWFFFDVDQTLINPKDALFFPNQGRNPFADFLDDFKAEASKNNLPQEKIEAVLGAFREKRQSMLVDQGFPALINTLKKKGHFVYALTKLVGGSCGRLASIERWRYEELKKFGIHFSPSHNNSDLVYPLKNTKNATAHRGIFFTGHHTKSETLAGCIQHFRYKPPQVVLFDDKLENLTDVSLYCQKNKIPFFGFCYRGIDLHNQPVMQKRAHLQKRYLLTKHLWLSDQEADSLLLKEE